MAFRSTKTGKRRRTRKVGSKKNRTKKRRSRGGVSLTLQNKIRDYNVNCRVKNRFTGKWEDKRGNTACQTWKTDLEEQYKQERPDREQMAADYGVGNSATSIALQKKIKDYKNTCQVKSWSTGKFVDKKNSPTCDLQKKSLEGLIYNQEKVDPVGINDTITKPKKRWGVW